MLGAGCSAQRRTLGEDVAVSVAAGIALPRRRQRGARRTAVRLSQREPNSRSPGDIGFLRRPTCAAAKSKRAGSSGSWTFSATREQTPATFLICW